MESVCCSFQNFINHSRLESVEVESCSYALLFTRCSILNYFISQLDLQANGSYTVFVCPSASTVFLLLCCVCKLHQEEAEKWQQEQLLQKVSSIK